MKPFLLVVFLVEFFAFFSEASRSTSEESAEALFHQTVAAWSKSQKKDWSPWDDFSRELLARFQTSNEKRLENIGALEEGILVIEQSIFRHGEGENPSRDASLSRLYTVYAKILSALGPSECLDLALDPHTLLIGAETVDLQSKPDTRICIENAENSFRNAATLDATNFEAEQLLQGITGDESTIHKRKPKEFVAELFDSFASTFDEKLLSGLQYKVPTLVGELARSLKSENSAYHAILDAGCGTGLAGRFLRPLQEAHGGVLVGVDASQNMLNIAAQCTTSSGCGIQEGGTGEKKKDRALYDSLLKMDLEEMTTTNTLGGVTEYQRGVKGYDLIVAADVLVYFGSLENLLRVFANVSIEGAHLIFSCELATEDEAPLGWRLRSSGRFAHTKHHAVETANKVGYSLVHYEEIVPRMEKGEPVRGHLFGFVLKQANVMEGEL